VEKFEEDLNRLKNKINSMSLSDDFKEELSRKLDAEYNKTDTRRHFSFPKQIIAAFACCIVLTSCVFADSIGNVITIFFANTSKEMEQALENGEMQKIDMEYVERDGVSIKVDYAMVKEDSIYLVFDVLCEEEISDIKFLDYEIRDLNQNVIFNKLDFSFKYIEERYVQKRIDTKNILVCVQLFNTKNIKPTDILSLNVNIRQIKLVNNTSFQDINNKGTFQI